MPSNSNLMKLRELEQQAIKEMEEKIYVVPTYRTEKPVRQVYSSFADGLFSYKGCGKAFYYTRYLDLNKITEYGIDLV